MLYPDPAPTARVAAALLCAILVSAAPALATDATRQAAEIAALKQQLQDLQERVERLEAGRDQGFSFDVAPEVAPVAGGWRKAHNWNLLQEGMTNYRVKEILGEPDRQKTVKKFEFWYYGDGKVSVYLRRLKSWEMPSAIDSE